MIDFSDFKNAERVFYFFEKICSIPHGSANTDAIADMLVDFARERGLEYQRDKANNVMIRKAATPGYESRPTVIFQAHIDMVLDKVEGCQKDLLTEPIELYREGDKLSAGGTTLGGDDGIGVAYALAVLDSDDLVHPEFEALFTSDEEIGLIGAAALDASFLKGHTLINLDSGTEGVFLAGCAGGMRINSTLDFSREEAPNDNVFFRISVEGLIGGHSGTSIDHGRINAIKLLNEIVSHLNDVRIASINGGSADNAIPREAECIFSATPSSKRFFETMLMPTIEERYRKIEPDMKISIEEISERQPVFSIIDTAKIFRAITRLPYGVIKMSEEIRGKVESSANLGIIKTEGDCVRIAVSIRSSKENAKEEMRLSIHKIARELGAKTEDHGAYPGWEFKLESHLRDVMSRVYQDMYGCEPTVTVVHAGLECGLLAEKISNLDCVSIGPNQENIHTPEEEISISSIARVWDFLRKVLGEI